MTLALLFKIGARQAAGQFEKKILFDEVGAMGFGYQPAVHGRLAMRRAQHFGTGQGLPAALAAFRSPVIKCYLDEMIF